MKMTKTPATDFFSKSSILINNCYKTWEKKLRLHQLSLHVSSFSRAASSCFTVEFVTRVFSRGLGSLFDFGYSKANNSACG